MMRILALIAFACALLLSACGGDNAASNTGGACTGSDTPTEQTPEQKRQAVVDKMKAAIAALDGDAVVPLFPADEKAMVEDRIVKEMKGMKDEGMKITVKSAKIEEVDGKFFVTFEQTLEAEGVTEDDSKKLRLLEVDGNWFLSFKK